MDWKLLLQIAGVLLGLVYLLLEYKASIWLWPVGILMPAVHAVLYYKAGLYADSGMELYYVAAGVWGLVVWLRSGGKTGADKAITVTPHSLWGRLGAVCAVVWACLYIILDNLTDSTVPLWDALTTALSMAAMWMLSRKYVEQWLVWLAVDAITVVLYFYKGIPLTALLYLLYTLLAVAGYRKWKKNAVIAPATPYRDGR